MTEVTVQISITHAENLNEKRGIKGPRRQVRLVDTRRFMTNENTSGFVHTEKHEMEMWMTTILEQFTWRGEDDEKEK